MVEVSRSAKWLYVKVRSNSVYAISFILFIVGLIVISITASELAKSKSRKNISALEAPPSFIPRSPIEPILFRGEPSPSPFLTVTTEDVKNETDLDIGIDFGVAGADQLVPTQQPFKVITKSPAPVPVPTTITITTATSAVPTATSGTKTPSMATLTNAPSLRATSKQSMVPTILDITMPQQQPQQQIVPTIVPTQVTTTNHPIAEAFATDEEVRSDELWETLRAASDLVEVENSPQFQAAQWIIDVDQKRLTADSNNLIQRFSLATFYFATTSTARGTGGWQYCGVLSQGGGDESCVYVDYKAGPYEAYRFLSSEDECEWAGIDCKEQEVSLLRLPKNNITGSLPTEIGLLTRLEKLILPDNALSGTLPEQIGDLIGLAVLHLQDNALTGSIPESIYKLWSLEILNLGDNHLTGEISKKIKNMEDLEHLSFRNNNFEGGLPGKELGKLVRLTSLSLDYNEWQSNFPKEFGKLTNLRKLFMGRSMITGKIPHEISRMTKLEDISLIGNALVGSIPDISTLSSLSSFRAEWNSLTGTLPQLPSSIKIVSLHRNHLWGPLPDLFTYTSLTSLSLFYNDLTGSIPWSVCSQFQVLEVDCLELIECDCCTVCCDKETGCI